MTTLDVGALRRHTPGCESVLHLDHAGSSLPPQPVVDAVIEHLQLEARWGGYRAEQERSEDIQAVYQAVAQLIGSDADEVALVESATRAWQLAVSALSLKAGDRIAFARTEYGSNYLAYLQLKRRFGIELVPIVAAADGSICLEALARELDKGVALVALTHIATNGGLVHPARQVGQLCRQADVPFLLDACQSAGQVDLRTIPWDIVSASGRKYLRGPRGTGFLGIRRPWLERLGHPLMDMRGATWTGPETFSVRSDARRFELWERNIADVLGLGAAVRYALDCGMEALELRIAQVGDALRHRLRSVEGVTVRDRGDVRCGITTFTLEGVSPADVKAALRSRNVHVSVSAASSTLLDMSDRQLPAVVRASVHALTTDEELDAFVAHLKALWG